MKNALLLFLTLELFSLINGTRIIGGSEAPEGAAPYIVSLRSINNQHFCAGSIITHKTIVTTANCVIDYPIENITVIAGTNSLELGGVDYRVEDVIIHPSYHAGYKHNDVALVILESNITFTSLIQPIALHSSIIGENEIVTLFGWGITSLSESLSNKLQIINLETISVYSCQGAMVTIGWINETQLCTLTDSSKGACNGDYGGSVTFDGELVGIASWSVPCGKGFPDVHSRISSFAKWIQDNLI